MVKKKLGIVSLTSCMGCSFEFLNLKGVLEILDSFDVVNFNLIKGESEENLDILFVEGAVSRKEEEELLKKLREKTEVLVALGSCAYNGNFLVLRNKLKDPDIEIYGRKIIDMELKPINSVVKVDYFLPGCPFSKAELNELLTCYLQGIPFRLKNQPVCISCRKYRKTCLLKEGILCLGAITRDGCDAICTRNNMPCIGCRGTFEGANIKAFVKLAEKLKGKEKLEYFFEKEVKKLGEEKT